MVTSGGMLLEKLDSEDPQLSKQEPFDGVRAYAQNKRQMVIQILDSFFVFVFKSNSEL